MGREIKRVPIDFDWPIGVIWPGFTFSLCSKMEYVCKVEKEKGERCNLCRKYAQLSGYEISTYNCPILPLETLPKGEGYQLWETTSEGSPMSPVFSTPEELAEWLEFNKASSFGSMTCSYDQWLDFIRGPGWAPSAIFTPEEGLRSGVCAAKEG